MIAAPHHRIEILRARFLSEPMPMMRAHLLSSLVEIGDEGLVSFLLDRLEEGDRTMKADCLECLQRFDAPEILERAEGFLDDPHPNLRRLAVLILWPRGDRRALARVVYDLFPSMKEEDYAHLPLPSRASYLFGIRTVGDIRLETAIPALCRGLAWEDETVRLECACSLKSFGRTDGEEALRALAENGNEEALRRREQLVVDNLAFFR